MSFKVTLQPSSQQFDAAADTTLLQAALDAGLILPYGCRDGACGACKGRVISGALQQGPAQTSALSDAERAQGYALLCCSHACSDLVLEVPNVRRAGEIQIKKLPCRVEKLERLAPDVMRMLLRLPANNPFQFLAGQYIDFLLADGRRRSFSIASAPQQQDMLELHLRLMPEGKFTTHVFNTMKEREMLRFEGPLGSFYLRRTAEEGGAKPVVLMAGGTGFAPIKSIVEDCIARADTERPMHLYWGARDRDGLYMHELAQHWAATVPGFSYVPVISDQPPVGWDGRRGLVHHAVMADLPDLSGYQVYACGAPAMIEAAREDFRSRCGLPIEEFYADAFTFAADTNTSA